MTRISVIGSTGSVGRSTLEVVDSLKGEFEVAGLAVNRSVRVLAQQVARYSPRVVAIRDPSLREEFLVHCASLGVPSPEILSGPQGVRALAEAEDVDIVVSAAVGAAGLEPTYAALSAGKRVALANKEAMVIAGELLRKTADSNGGLILPVDSEHNAIDQCLRSGHRSEIRRLILTASGGPFLKRPRAEFRTVTPDEALNHPTWKMGPRITIDSATLMNKGLEVIEARWLFDVDANSIDVVIHPQSIIHSMVEFIDGSIVAQLGSADMRGPIQYALTFPHRQPSIVRGLDWSSMPSLDFSLPDPERFPAIAMACEALEIGGTAPAVLNAADEVAVEAFLERRISFIEIPEVIKKALMAHSPMDAGSLSTILESDLWARQYAAKLIASAKSDAARRPPPLEVPD